MTNAPGGPQPASSWQPPQQPALPALPTPSGPPVPTAPHSPAVGYPPPGLPGPPSGNGGPPAPRGRGSAAKIWAILLGILLVLAVGAAAVLLAFFLQTSTELEQANEELDRREQQIQEQEEQLGEQQEQLDEKEVFGEVMQSLMGTVRSFDGAATGDLVDFDRLDRLARSAWEDRHDPSAVRGYTAEAQRLQAELQGLLDTAAGRAANSSGTTAEAIIDSLGRGFVETVWGDATAVCQSEALGCVWGGDPYVIHLDAAGFAQPFRTEWGETLVAYHEYAHVLQFTNPAATDGALGAFGGDSETMADCYALTMLDSWTLEERVWQTSRSYWDVSYGYGHVCDDSQRQVIRDWVAQVGVQYRPVSQ